MPNNTQLLPELLSFLDNQPEPRIVMDADYRIVAANAAYQREFGSEEEVVGRHCYAVSHHFSVPCDQAGESCPLRMSQEDGKSHRVLHLHHTPRGKQHVEVETSPVVNAEGKVAYFVETMRVARHASSRPIAEGLVGKSAAFNHMLGYAMRVAPTSASVLLLGETGTGKELVAHLVHEASHRANGPFVAVDCSGLTESLFESELFGYEKGAFTGALHRKTGLVEAASGGTLFLDEIGDVPLPLQVKLLRLLETGTYRRVGGVETLQADFRLVCATHRNLPLMVENETFRRDLYHRTSIFPMRIPSLAERMEDIPLLAESMLKRVSAGRPLSFSPDALAVLQSRLYKGNIRELRNLIERASILVDGYEIMPIHLQDDWHQPVSAPVNTIAGDSASCSEQALCFEQVLPLEDVEQRYLEWAEQHYAGSRTELAQQLGVSVRTLFRKLK